MNTLKSWQLLLATWCLPAVALAQPGPPAAAEDDDLELPANSTPAAAPPAAPPPAATATPAPAAGVSAPGAQTGPAATPAAPAASVNGANTDTERAQIVALEQRIATLEASGIRPDQPAHDAEAGRAKEDAEATGPVNLERSAHSRPVPTGLRIGGYVQAQYEHNQLSEDQLQQGGLPLNQDRFLLRRARLRLDRGWEWASATLELDANTVRGPAVGIRRAEASLLYRGDNPDSMPPLVMVTLGVTDLPFGFELAESSRVRVFLERSLASLSLFPTEMDAGVKVSGAWRFLRYAVAVTNGEPVDHVTARFDRDPNAAKDVSGRFGVDVGIGERFHVSGGSSFYTGKGFHEGTQATKPELSWTDTNEDSIVQPNEIVATPGSVALPSENFDRWAVGADLQLRLTTGLGDTTLYGEAYAASNLDRGLFVADPVASASDVRHVGGYVGVLQDVTEYGVVGFRASFYDPNSDFLEQRRGIQVPTSQTITVLSPIVGLILEDRARLLFQYDFVDDSLAKDARGLPTDAENNQWAVRLQVEL